MLGFIKSLFSRKKELPLISEVVQIIEPKAEEYIPDPARELLKKATRLKKEKKFDEACDTLKEAYAMPEAYNFTIKDKLRLPMYLQLAKKGDEAWRLLGEMERAAWGDPINSRVITDQCRVFLEKEKNYTKALYFSLLSLCYEIETEKHIHNDMRKTEEELIRLNEELSEIGALEETEKDKQRQQEYEIHTKEKLDNLKSHETVGYAVSRLLQKAKMSDIIEDVTKDIVDYLNSKERCDGRTINNILNEHFSAHYAKQGK